jgi:predicted transposase YbfD/YdcC
MARSPLALRKYLRRLKDPRIDRNKRHLLLDIITIAVCAVIAGANKWIDVVTFAQHRKDWLQRFLELPNGIPSHDTFERLFDRLEPLALQNALIGWLHSISETLGFRHIAIDGKTVRQMRHASSPLRQLHLVSAWATEANLTLGQVAVDDKSNEITAIPKLLELLDLHGLLVSIDAMGCQKEIASMIVERGGDYLLTVKDNQEMLKNDIVDCFVQAYENDCRNVKYEQHETVEKGHGREERRVYEIIADPVGLRDQHAWAKLTVIGKCYRECTIQGQVTCEERYFIGSKRCGVRRYADGLRNHWRIENCLHWQMDVTFAEDNHRMERRNGGQNFTLLGRLALGLIKQHPDKGSVRSKRYAATLDVKYLEEILKK